MQRRAADTATGRPRLEDEAMQTLQLRAMTHGAIDQCRADIQFGIGHSACADLITLLHQLHRRARYAQTGLGLGTDGHEMKVLRQRSHQRGLMAMTAIVAHRLTQQATTDTDSRWR